LLVEAGWAAVQTDTRLKSPLPPAGFRQLPQPRREKESDRRRGTHPLVIVWHVLTTGKTYTDLGPGSHTHRLDPEKETSA